MFTIEEISVVNKKNREIISQFLTEFNLEYDNDIDYTIAVYDTNKLIGTASKSRNVLKCFAVLEEYQGLGIVNTLIKMIEDRMFKDGIYHFFIYTKSCNKQKFISIGYKEIISDLNITILENGDKNIESYLKQIKSIYHLSNHPKACVIMNGNPFTKGHRYLIEKASYENKEVLVLVVSEEQSTFPFSIRYQLIKEGVRDLKNVQVAITGPYLVSNVSFPTYFIKNKDDIVKLQATLDCEIFLKYYKEIFNINSRYVGDEPYCKVTNTYNQVMLELLPINGVKINKIDRLVVDNEIVSASIVRELLRLNDFNKLKQYVPDTTYSFLISNEAIPIINQIKENKRH